MNAWKCPCGCGLRLDAGQQAREAWLNALANHEPVGHAPSTVSVSAAKYQDQEPVDELPCRSCAKEFRMPKFVAEFVSAHRLRMDCENCR